MGEAVAVAVDGVGDVVDEVGVEAEADDAEAVEVEAEADAVDVEVVDVVEIEATGLGEVWKPMTRAEPAPVRATAARDLIVLVRMALVS
ncbi:MAG: hypothetical protein U0838_17090 [Chloroflexota bacterium]